MSEAIHFIQDLAVILIAAALAGLACKKIGLSPIVGYLVAGIAVGPSTPLHGFVNDIERVHVLGELGLVFLMFGIGLGFSLRRLKRLGLGVLVAAVIESFIVFNLGRLGGLALGLDRAASVFFASMLVISSSAVIGKILTDLGRGHERSSQLAIGVMLCEDVVVIVLLTLLGSYARFVPGATEAAARPEMIKTLALFGGFVLVIAVLGLLLVPRVLRRLSREATAELETIFVAGLLFGLSLMVVHAGYSLALGAFLLGAIVGDTPQRAHVEKAFTGLHAIFGTMFFVAIGMTIDLRDMPGAIGPLLTLTALALLGRALAAAVAILVIGQDTRVAIKTALVLTPIGEFSFIIAQMGTSNGILPTAYMPAAVGASLLTAFISPVLIRHNTVIAEWLGRWRLPLLSRLLRVHRRVLEMLQRRRQSNLLWNLTRRRFVQIGIELAIVSAALAFARPAISSIEAWLGAEAVPGISTTAVCWTGLGLVLLAPLVAIWRNVQAVAMIFGDYLGQLSPTLHRMAPTFIAIMQAVSALALGLWLFNFLPSGGSVWIVVGIIALLVLLAVGLWHRLILWHSQMEISVETSLGNHDETAATSYGWMNSYAPWGLQIGELTLPDRTPLAGKSIADVAIRKRFGCSVIGIERQSFTIANPGPHAHLFPGDRILLVGTDQQITAARTFLLSEDGHAVQEDTFADLSLEMVEVPESSPAASRRLADLNWPRLLGVQVVGHERSGTRTITPPADLRIAAGDSLLVLGAPQQVNALRDALHPTPPASLGTDLAPQAPASGAD